MGLLPNPFEWPVGYSSDVARDTAGRYIVVHRPSSRLQVYDQNKRFLSGCSLKPPSKGLKSISQKRTISNFSLSRKISIPVFPRGKVLEEGPLHPHDEKNLPSSPLISAFFSDPVVPLALTNPVIAWVLGALGLVGLCLLEKYEDEEIPKTFPISSNPRLNHSPSCFGWFLNPILTTRPD